jgi:cycloeucalenol cycloisomerase
MTATPRPRGCWFSKNPSKAWGEKFFLCYLPFFFALNGAIQAFGLLDAGNAGHLAQNVAMLAPLYLYPLIVRDETSLGRAWHQTYWFKFNAWIYVFAFAGTYFFTEYFFDVLGMVYHFPRVTLHFDSTLLGSGAQRVPLGMYFNGAAFFAVYHTLAVIVMRRVRTSALGRVPLSGALTILATAYCFAWAETRLVATEANAGSFYYRDLAFMLRYGSMFYACYFVVSFPMVYRLDERPGDCWSLSRTCADALAAAMLVFGLLDLCTRLIGPPAAAAGSPLKTSISGVPRHSRGSGNPAFSPGDGTPAFAGVPSTRPFQQAARSCAPGRLP